MRTRLTTLFLLGSFLGISQQYISPIGIPIKLSGNFGEMRRNHFHTGLDIRTEGREGVPLRSIADGFISRIKVSPVGYGNALYIDHPDGHTSVYAHMSAFNGAIAKAVHEAQYAQETWEIEFYPEPGTLPVKQGEIIGLSGNSGSSAGPHLHFEIRETDSEHPLNPQEYGITIDDHTRPVIQGLRLYPLDENSTVAGAHEAKSTVVKDQGEGEYLLESPVTAFGNIGLALHSYDRMDGVANKYGLFSLEMRVDGKPVYVHTMKALDFENFRQVNCHADYELFRTNAWRYHKTFPAENNTLQIYDLLVDGGRIHVAEGDAKNIEFIAKDFQGNSSELRFILRGEKGPLTPAAKEQGIFWDAATDNVFKDSSAVVQVPKGRIYEDLYLRPSFSEQSDALSKVFFLHDQVIPLDDYITVKLKVEGAFKNREHLVMMLDEGKGRTACLGGEYKNGWIQARTKTTGSFYVKEDEQAPKITITRADNSAAGKLTLNLSDDLSGLDSLRVEVDGKWLMMAHNANMSSAWGALADLELAPGPHHVKVQAWDQAGNEAKLEKEIKF